MKIQCDVCSKESASVFCPSDEAALCDACDRSVHRANKLAGKHTRFSLLHQSVQEIESSPKCDICQDRRAFLFCQEDRAILCRECDFTIHRTNEHTQKHNRFLLTGVKISEAAAAASSSSSSTASEPYKYSTPSSEEYFMETLQGGGWQFDEFNGLCNSKQMMYDEAVQFLGEDNNNSNNNNNNNMGGRDDYQNKFFH